MSGRGAYARAKANKQVNEKNPHKPGRYEASEPYNYTFSSGPISVSRPAMTAQRSYASPSPAEYYPSPARGPPRRRSVSSAGSYGASQLRQPRPIIVASAIEKSDFRTHLDGMSNNLRGKLGKLFGGSDSDSASTLRRPNTASNTTASSGSDSPGATFTPLDNAGRSLSPITSPSEVTSAYPGGIAPPSRSRTSHDRTRAVSERSYTSKHRGDSVLHQIRRFEGGGKLPQLGWKSMATNPELWDEKGDTFVYVYIRGSRTKPPPSFRLRSRVIEASGSKQLLDRLYNTREPEGWPKFVPDSHNYQAHPVRSRSPPEDSIDFDPYDLTSRGTESDDGDVVRPLGVTTKAGGKTPPGIEFELYFEWPGSETGVHSTLWHVTTRNFFAIMYDAGSLVGTTLYDCIKMLLERMLTYADYLDRSISHAGWIIDYLVRHQFDDVRNNPSYAASLLAFSELPQVRWREGYIEAFVHCAGMLHMGLDTVTEWRHVSAVTKMYLSNANLELEERIHRAQVWLHDFDFSEMWPATSAPPSSARGCCDRFRKWLCKYYENAFLHWPPSNEETWLNRDVVLRLRNDFHGLYDYLVDRDASFDGSNFRPGQRWNIVSTTSRHFHADSADLPVTDMLLAFDARNNFPHVPHPYPKVPPSLPAALPKATGKTGGFHIKKSHGGPDNSADARRKALSYAEASNVYVLRDQYMHTDLVSNFIRFEQSDMVDQSDPFEARRGRWIMIYGILQVLATISVDHPGLRYTDGVQYHLSPQMKGVLPWSPADAPPEEEADHTHSHCWAVPQTWHDQTTLGAQKPQHPQRFPSQGLPHQQGTQHRPIIWGQYGDGRVRGDSTTEPITSPTSEYSGARKVRDASSADTRPHHKLKASRSTSAMNAMSSGTTKKANHEGGETRKRMEEWVANTNSGVGPRSQQQQQQQQQRASSTAGDSSTSAPHTASRAPSSLASDAGATSKPRFGTFTTIESARSPAGSDVTATAANTSGHAGTGYFPRSGSRLGRHHHHQPRGREVSQSGSSEGWSVADTATREVSITRQLNTTHAADAMNNIVTMGNTQARRKPGTADGGASMYQPPSDW